MASMHLLKMSPTIPSAAREAVVAVMRMGREMSTGVDHPEAIQPRHFQFDASPAMAECIRA
jgi:hypothetical protein